MPLTNAPCPLLCWQCARKASHCTRKAVSSTAHWASHPKSSIHTTALRTMWRSSVPASAPPVTPHVPHARAQLPQTASAAPAMPPWTLWSKPAPGKARAAESLGLSSSLPHCTRRWRWSPGCRLGCCLLICPRWWLASAAFSSCWSSVLSSWSCSCAQASASGE